MVRIIGFDAKKKVYGLEVRKDIGNGCEIIQKRCFERVGNVVSETKGSRESDIRTRD